MFHFLIFIYLFIKFTNKENTLFNHKFKKFEKLYKKDFNGSEKSMDSPISMCGYCLDCQFNLSFSSGWQFHACPIAFTTHTTRVDIYIYIYIEVCVCVCVHTYTHTCKDKEEVEGRREGVPIMEKSSIITQLHESLAESSGCFWKGGDWWRLSLPSFSFGIVHWHSVWKSPSSMPLHYWRHSLFLIGPNKLNDSLNGISSFESVIQSIIIIKTIHSIIMCTSSW